MRIFVKAKPAANQNEVVQLDGDHFEVSVKEPPVQGRANRAIVGLLADHFGVSVGSIRIVTGATSRNKIIDIG